MYLTITTAGECDTQEGNTFEQSTANMEKVLPDTAVQSGEGAFTPYTPADDLANNSFINMVLPKGVEAGGYLELKTENGTFYTSVPDAKAVSAGPRMQCLPSRAKRKVTLHVPNVNHLVAVSHADQRHCFWKSPA